MFMEEKLFSLAHISRASADNFFSPCLRLPQKIRKREKISICPATNGSISAFYDSFLIETVSTHVRVLSKLPITYLHSKYRKENTSTNGRPESLHVSVHRCRINHSRIQKIVWTITLSTQTLEHTVLRTPSHIK